VPLPDEEWRRTVMARVRREPRPTRVVPVLTLERTAWRAGLATAVAASIFAIISLAAMPSKERLAWDLYKGGAMAQLSIRIGE